MKTQDLLMVTRGAKRYYFHGGAFRGATTLDGARVVASRKEIAEARKLTGKLTSAKAAKPARTKASAPRPKKPAALPFLLDGQRIGLAGIQRRHSLTAAELTGLRALRPGQALELRSGGGVWGRVQRVGAAPRSAGAAPKPRASLTLRATRRYAKLALARGDQTEAARYLGELAGLTGASTERLRSELAAEVNAAKQGGFVIGSDADARALERSRRNGRR